jgi:autotransporter-associated beta strand protein
MHAALISKTRLVSLILGIGFCKTLLAVPQLITVNAFSTQEFINTSSAVNTSITVTNNSTVEFLDSSTISSGNVSLDATSQLIFNQVSNDTVLGQITGTGTILKQGTPELTISSNNSAFAGNTFVQGGALNILTDLGGNVTVESSAAITISGTVGGNLTLTGGTAIPGAVTVGQLNVGGNYASNGASTYDVNINGANATLIEVTGTASVNGTVDLLSAIGPTLMKYPILHATGGVIVQNYSTLIQSPFLKFMIGYDANNVYLLYAGSNFSLVGETPNQRHVATAIDSIVIPTLCEMSFIGVLSGLPLPKVLNALDSFSGAQYAYLTDIVQSADRNFNRTIYQVIREQFSCPYCEGENIQAWVDVGYGKNYAHGYYNARGYRAHNNAFSAGVYTCAIKNFLLGLAGEYERDHVNFIQKGRNIFHTGQGSLYASYKYSRVYVFSDLIIGHTTSSFKRPIRYGASRNLARSQVTLNHGLFYIEVGGNIMLCDFFDEGCSNSELHSNFLCQPFAGYEQDYTHGNHIKEQGAQCLNLEIEKKNVSGENLYLGAHFSGAPLSYLILNGDVAWKHRFGAQGTTNKTRFRDFGSRFNIYGSDQGANGLIGTFEILGLISDTFEINCALSGEKWKRWSAFQISAGVNAKW